MEREIGLALPADLREFFLRCGGGYVGSIYIYGIHEPEDCRNEDDTESAIVREQRLYKQEQGFPGIDDWIVFTDDGYGNPIGIAPDGRVLRIDHDRGMEVTEVAESFEALLMQLLREEPRPKVPSLPLETYTRRDSLWTCFQKLLGPKSTGTSESQKVYRRVGPALEDCETAGKAHHWFNIDDKLSGCYNCRLICEGQLWRK